MRKISISSHRILFKMTTIKLVLLRNEQLFSKNNFDILWLKSFHKKKRFQIIGAAFLFQLITLVVN